MYQKEFVVTASFRFPRRRVRVLQKEYHSIGYKPQFAIGILCASQKDQQRLYRSLAKSLPDHEVKVLVI